MLLEMKGKLWTPITLENQTEKVLPTKSARQSTKHILFTVLKQRVWCNKDGEKDGRTSYYPIYF